MAIALLGCERPPNASGTDAIAVALELPAGVAVTAVDWTVRSSSDEVLAFGAIDTSGPRASPSFGVDLLPGAGDVVEMTATTSDGATCSGASAPFDVVGGRAVSVSVALVCATINGDAGAGSLSVSATLVAGDTCPVIEAWSIAAVQASAGGPPIAVSIKASDPDAGDLLTFAWTATGGSFTDGGAPSTEYACGTPGVATVSVEISDNHEPTPCLLDVSFPPVTCL